MLLPPNPGEPLTTDTISVDLVNLDADSPNTDREFTADRSSSLQIRPRALGIVLQAIVAPQL